MQKTPSYQCYVGSVGWEHAAWQAMFYPEDLPPEWHLTFYNNHFSCVYLPYAEWSSRTIAELSAWCNDVMAHFRFVLEINPNGLDSVDKEKLTALSSHLGLLVDAFGKVVPENELKGEILWLAPQPDYKELARLLQLYTQQGAQVFLISREHDLNVMNEAQRLLEIMGV